jgi:hypothetical protein
MPTIPIEEYIVFALLLLGVVGIYYALKFHYIFAFKLVQKTSISATKKQKIDKIKYYVFAFLKVLLGAGLVFVAIFSTMLLMEGLSLKHFVIDAWHHIPKGFWSLALWTLARIALLIVVMKFVLKKLFDFLITIEEKTTVKKEYNSQSIHQFYTTLITHIKLSVVFGVAYRIVHFFPFLDTISFSLGLLLCIYILLAMGLTLDMYYKMKKSRSE